MTVEVLGILAGRGDLPRRIVQHCRQIGRPYFVVAIKGQANPGDFEAEPHAWVRLGAAGRTLALLRENDVRELVLAGGIERPSLAALRPDSRALRFFAKLGKARFGDDGLLRAVVRALEEDEGLRIVGPDQIMGELTVQPGVIGRLTPDESAERDIARGVDVLRMISEADVGQAAVVQDGIVLGVEAVEGTDALLVRCAALKRSGPGGVLVKIAKAGQETRVDLPTIGPETVRNAAAAGLRGIAVEAGRTLVLDRDVVARSADEAGLFVTAIVV